MEMLYSLEFLKRGKKTDITPDKKLPNYFTNGAWMIHKSLYSEKEVLKFNNLEQKDENSEKEVLDGLSNLEKAEIEDCFRPFFLIPVVEVKSENYKQIFNAYFVKLVYGRLVNFISLVDVYLAMSSLGFPCLVFKKNDLVLAVIAPIIEE